MVNIGGIMVGRVYKKLGVNYTIEKTILVRPMGIQTSVKEKKKHRLARYMVVMVWTFADEMEKKQTLLYEIVLV